MRDIELFSTGSIYHVYGRGVDRRTLFENDADRSRFIKSLIAFNDQNRCSTTSLSRIENPTVSDTPYVDIISFCLMPNHFHLMLKQHTSDAISEFMRRLMGGYSRYFNKRNRRIGPLFEGPYKIKRLTTTIQQRHLSRYIHLNPLELAGLDYKRGRISWKNAESYLRSYVWSSFRHFVGLDQLPFVHEEVALTGVGDARAYLEFLQGWVERDWKSLSKFDEGFSTR